MLSAILLSLAPSVPLVVASQRDLHQPTPTAPAAATAAASLFAAPPQAPSDLGGAAYDPFAPPVVVLGLGGPNIGIYELNLPQRRWKERVVVGLPDPNANHPQPYPVLTLFHGFGEVPEAVPVNTPLVTSALNRGWTVVIPLGAHVYNYGIDYAQDNIEDVFEFVQQLAPIDLDRVYAVGFSMGGGAAASYAARHLDPQHVRFAAVVNHTGSTSLRNTHDVGGIPSLFGSALMFSGTPSSAPFRYQRSSVIDLRAGNLIDPETDMVRNLVHVPVFHWSATNDPLQYLITQSYQMHQRLQYWGGESRWSTAPASTHSWTTMPATILDDLEPITWQAPTEGENVPVLADRSGRWHMFDIEQSRARAFSPFQFNWIGNDSLLALTQIDNIRSIGFDITDPALGFLPNQILTLDVQTRVLAPLDVRIRGLAGPPSAVHRRGTVTNDWSWNATTQVLTLLETSATSVTNWYITP